VVSRAPGLPCTNAPLGSGGPAFGARRSRAGQRDGLRCAGASRSPAQRSPEHAKCLKQSVHGQRRSCGPNRDTHRTVSRLLAQEACIGRAVVCRAGARPSSLRALRRAGRIAPRLGHRSGSGSPLTRCAGGGRAWRRRLSGRLSLEEPDAGGKRGTLKRFSPLPVRRRHPAPVAASRGRARGPEDARSSR
jgi:hypothetical protein